MSTLEYSEALSTYGRSSRKNVHNCKQCPYFTTTLFLMFNHVRQHRSSPEKFKCENAKIEPYYCKDCNFKTDLTILFKQHIDTNHGFKQESGDDSSSRDLVIENYVCENCDFATNFSLKWFQHTSRCTREKAKRCSCKKSCKWYECGHCPYKTTFKHKLKRHQNSPHLSEQDAKWYECNNCHFKTKHKSSLEFHTVAKHPNLQEQFKTYKCKSCKFETKHVSNLRRHVISVHLDEIDIKWYECQQCSFRAKLRYNLTEHMKRDHSKKSEWYKCAKCSYKSKMKPNLKSHLKVHLERKPFQCEYCPFRTKYSGSLTDHKNNCHLDGTGAKWFECEHCTYKSKSRSTFYKHRKKHCR